MPPKATKRPTPMAGTAEPGVPSGFLSIIPMVGVRTTGARAIIG